MEVKIDVSDFIAEWKLNAQEAELFVYNVLDEISVRFAEEWKNNAGKVLKQAKGQYQRAIYIERPSPQTVVVGLAGWLPNAIEKGIEPFDMKEGFEASSKKKLSKTGGWYLTIPFRIGTPDIVGESDIFASIMPNAVYQVAKNELRNGRSSLTFDQLPSAYQSLGVRPEVIDNLNNKVFAAYTHKAPIYQGMTRYEDDKGHGTYMTFRRVSSNSDPNSWIHTGIKARNLMDKTLQDVDFGKIVSNVKENFLQNR